jgi:hypothetical protein
MQNDTIYLQFECYNCGFHNNYPAIKDENAKGGDVLLKRCMSCAAYNEVKLPNNFRAQMKTVFRGMKHDE